MYCINRKNGAGKSTLIDILIGHKHANSGTVEDKLNLISSHNMGILFQTTNLPKLIKVKRTISFISTIIYQSYDI